MIDISIIIPSLGNITNLSRLLDSIQKQKTELFSVEIIIVFNGIMSEEKKQNLIVWSQNYLKHVSIFFNKSKGVNAARNTGIRMSKSDILLFLDDDCVIENINFINKHIKFHNSNPDIFSYGGGYSLPEGFNYWDKLYNNFQLSWLYSGLMGQNSKQTRHLLGGNVSIKKKYLLDNKIIFDEYIIYGGSESELFRKSEMLSLRCILNDLDVLHYTDESFISIFKKIFKQGAGKAYIESKYGKSIENNSNEQFGSFISLDRIFKVFFNYVFWLGYYFYFKKPCCIFKHLFKDILGYINYYRHQAFKKLSDQIDKNKENGDRF